MRILSLLLLLVGCTQEVTQCTDGTLYTCVPFRDSGCRMLYETVMKNKPIKCVKRESR